MIKIYTTPTCPNCVMTKQILTDRYISFHEIDMRTPASMAELAFNNCFWITAPILEIQGNFHGKIRSIQDVLRILEIYHL